MVESSEECERLCPLRLSRSGETNTPGHMCFCGPVDLNRFDFKVHHCPKRYSKFMF